MHDVDLESAFAAYRADVEECQRTGDWSGYADAFTEGAVYRRRGYADFTGREAIRAFVHASMTSFPGDQMVGFELVWRSFEHSKHQVVFELRHVMRDPGDGSVHTASTISMLTYAGQGLWSRCDDVQNLHAYSEMMRGWSRAAEKHGTLGAEGTAYLQTLIG